MSNAPFRPTAVVPGPQFSTVAAGSCRQRCPLSAPVVVLRLNVTRELPKVGPPAAVPDATYTFLSSGLVLTPSAAFRPKTGVGFAAHAPFPASVVAPVLWKHWLGVSAPLPGRV